MSRRRGRLLVATLSVFCLALVIGQSPEPDDLPPPVKPPDISLLERATPESRARLAASIRLAGRAVGATVMADYLHLAPIGRLHALKLLADHDTSALRDHWAEFLADRDAPAVRALAYDLLQQSGGRSELELLKQHRPAGPRWLVAKWASTHNKLALAQRRTIPRRESR